MEELWVNLWRDFWLCFLPLFVAVDALGTLPMFIGLTSGMPRQAVRRTIVQSMFTALAVAVGFLIVGKAVFRVLGITIADFMIAGGILLLLISVGDLLTTEKIQRRVDPSSLGVVPLGVPLVVGPAVLTTIILLADAHGKVPTMLALIMNIGIAGSIYALQGPISRVLGGAGSKALSKISALILASIAVMFIRKGIYAFLGH